MTFPFHLLIKDIDKVNLEDICSSWQWCLQDQKAVVLISVVGDLFLLGKDNTVNWLDTSTGKIAKVADDPEDFQQLLNNEANIENWFLASLVEQLISEGKTLKENQVYSFKKLPTLGGNYSADNLEPTDIPFISPLSDKFRDKLKTCQTEPKLTVSNLCLTKTAAYNRFPFTAISPFKVFVPQFGIHLRSRYSDNSTCLGRAIDTFRNQPL